MEPNDKSPQCSPGLKPGPSNSFAMTNQISNPNHLGLEELPPIVSPPKTRPTTSFYATPPSISEEGVGQDNDDSLSLTHTSLPALTTSMPLTMTPPSIPKEAGPDTTIRPTTTFYVTPPSISEEGAGLSDCFPLTPQSLPPTPIKMGMTPPTIVIKEAGSDDEFPIKQQPKSLPASPAEVRPSSTKFFTPPPTAPPPTTTF